MANCCNCFQNSPDFSCLSSEETDLLNHRKVFIIAGKGENIIKQNTFISNIIYVIDGALSIILEGERNKNICIGIAGNGEILGVNDLLSNCLHSFTALSLKSSSICIFQADDFRSVLNTNLTFRDKILEKYSGYIKHLYSRLMVFGTKQLHGRLADTILYLYEIKKNIADIFQHISRKDIALMTGTSVENIVRLLKEFDHDGIIKINGKEIIINNLELLEKLRMIG